MMAKDVVKGEHTTWDLKKWLNSLKNFNGVVEDAGEVNLGHHGEKSGGEKSGYEKSGDDAGEKKEGEMLPLEISGFSLLMGAMAFGHVSNAYSNCLLLPTCL
ncbi:hypothetical protein L2E82_10770 [Cichorium intybus]|uniref:Uncharacterized protein n=1 Tax=Cichorium intybus TaxID=13427 RepID=A0ACB9GB97_CICIN|nr:hypothetical protein L2E82_10770 [Cichorium intybus]